VSGDSVHGADFEEKNVAVVANASRMT